MGAIEASAFWVLSPGCGEIRSVTVPDAQPGEVRVQTLFSAISRGTETLVFRGEVPPDEHQRMRAPFQEGEFPGPVKYGYINVGLVEQGPDPLQGHTVFCLYPHQSHYCVPADAVTLLPESLPAGRAVLTANLETALNGLWDAGLRIGDRVRIVGAGAVGCLVAWLAGRMPGTDVELVDVNPARAGIAAALGVRFATPGTASGEADLVVHASGRAAGLATAIELAGFEACVLELSWFGTRAVTVPLGGPFHSRRLHLKSSQVGRIASSQRARWSHGRRLALALELLADPVLDTLISDESRFSDLPQVISELAGGDSDALCHRIAYR